MVPSAEQLDTGHKGSGLRVNVGTASSLKSKSWTTRASLSPTLCQPRPSQASQVSREGEAGLPLAGRAVKKRAPIWNLPQLPDLREQTDVMEPKHVWVSVSSSRKNWNVYTNFSSLKLVMYSSWISLHLSSFHLTVKIVRWNSFRFADTFVSAEIRTSLRLSFLLIKLSKNLCDC